MTEALQLYHHLFRPSRSSSARTLLLLHGTGGDEASFAAVAPELDPAAAVLGLRGNVQENGLARFFRRLAEGVYDMDDLERRTGELAAFLEAACAHYAFDRDRLVGVGYSNGANILASLLFTRPELVPTAVLLRPLIPFEPGAQPGLRGRRVLITGGERDPICPLALTRALAAWFHAQGADSRLVLHGGGHELRMDELAAARAFLAEGAPA